MNEMKYNAQLNGEEIIEINDYFILSKNDNRIYLRASNEHELVFPYDNLISTKRPPGMRYVVLKCEYNNYVFFLIVDYEKKTIRYSEKEINTTFDNIYKNIVYDFNLQKVNSFLGELVGNSIEAEYMFYRLFDINDQTTYSFLTFERNNFSIIFYNGNTLKVLSKASAFYRTDISISNVKKWQRLSREFGNCTSYYNFFIAETDSSFILFNIKTKKSLSISFQYIVPTTFTFNKRDYELYNKKIKNITERQYVLVDNRVYDEHLDNIAQLTDEYDKPTLVLDTLGHFVATLGNDNKIHLLFAQPDNNKSFFRELNYYCHVRRDSEKKIELIADTSEINNLVSVFNYLRFISFDPIEKGFIVNEQLIKEEKAHQPLSDDEIIDNYNMLDALDGVSDAYWNID